MRLQPKFAVGSGGKAPPAAPDSAQFSEGPKPPVSQPQPDELCRWEDDGGYAGSDETGKSQ